MSTGKDLDLVLPEGRGIQPPDPVEPVDPGGISPGRTNKHQSDKTHCPQGHEYTAETTYIWYRLRTGKPCRTCKTCRTERSREFHKTRVRGQSNKKIKTHCRNGHEYTIENTYRTFSAISQGNRVCKICRKASNRRIYAKRVSVAGEIKA